LSEDLAVESSYIQLQNLTMHCKVGGTDRSEILIFLHGFPEFWYGWRHQIPFFLSRGYGVIAPDQRGYNLTEKPHSVRAYRFDHRVGDIVQLLDQQDCDDLTLVGHDWGGVIACAIAQNHPNLIRRVVVINAPHPGIFLKFMLTHPLQLIKSWYVFFFQLPALPEWILFGNPGLMSLGLKLTSTKNTFRSNVLECYRDAWNEKGAARGMLNWYRALLLNPQPFTNKNSSEIPALILWGSRDVALNQKLADLTVEQFENGQLKIFPEATHWVHHERVERVNQTILHFIQETGSIVD